MNTKSLPTFDNNPEADAETEDYQKYGTRDSMDIIRNQLRNFGIIQEDSKKTLSAILNRYYRIKSFNTKKISLIFDVCNEMIPPVDATLFLMDIFDLDNPSKLTANTRDELEGAVKTYVEKHP